MRHLIRFLRDEDAVATVETALIVVLMAIAAYAGYAGLGAVIGGYAQDSADVFAEEGP